MRGLVVVVVVLAGAARTAAAGPDGLVAAPTVIGIPTAWIQPAGAAHVSLDADHELASGVRVTKSLGPLAEVDVASDDLVLTCAPCAGDGRLAEGLQQVSGGFKLGVGQDTWFRHQPAIALGVFAPIHARGGARASEAFAVASLRAGPVRLHAGVSTWATEHTGAGGETITSGGLLAVRPLAGVEWTPTIYPRTTLSTDVQFLPELGPTAAETSRRWLFTWGVRYRAFGWGAIELAVKHREREKLDDAAVMLRMSARLGRGTRL